MNFLDAMRRYHGEIERNLYAAEQLCDKATDEECKACPFTGRYQRYVGCKVAPVRRILGEHRPPGTCQSGTVIGQQILCTALTACGYQKIVDHQGMAVCGREEAALEAIAEAEAIPEPMPEHPVVDVMR